MKKFNLYSLLFFILIATVSCNKNNEINDAFIQEELELTFGGFKIEPHEASNNDDDHCVDCEEFFEDKISNGEAPSGVCLSGSRVVTPERNYLYKFAVARIVSDIKWEVSGEMEILHIEFTEKDSYSLSSCVIKFNSNFDGGIITAHTEDEGSLITIPIAPKE